MYLLAWMRICCLFWVLWRCILNVEMDWKCWRVFSVSSQFLYVNTCLLSPIMIMHNHLFTWVTLSHNLHKNLFINLKICHEVNSLSLPPGGNQAVHHLSVIEQLRPYYYLPTLMNKILVYMRELIAFTICLQEFLKMLLPSRLLQICLLTFLILMDLRLQFQVFRAVNLLLS